MQPASDDTTLPPLYLKRGEDARLRAGHLWVFSNEVDTKRSPLTAFAPGVPCVIVDAADRALGVGYANPASLIAARLMVRGSAHALDRSLLVHRLNVALALRQRLYAEPFYRLLYGESDGVPGLTLDRFDDVIVAQATTAGIERLKPEVEAAVQKVLKPRAMIWKNDAGIRVLENLPLYADIAFGDLQAPVIAREGELRFELDVLGGQKTGWFYDQHANRDRFVHYVAGKRVLDVFSYLGAWGLRAAAAGATDVLCVDASQAALQCLQHAARDNGLEARVGVAQGDAFDMLKALRAARERFDVVVVDPPAFVKRKKDLAQGRLAYRRINMAAMQLLAPDGILVSCSCSHHLPRSELLAAIQAGARELQRQVQVLEVLQQGPDHPIHPAIPETDYLKGYLCRVLPA